MYVSMNHNSLEMRSSVLIPTSAYEQEALDSILISNTHRTPLFTLLLSSFRFIRLIHRSKKLLICFHNFIRTRIYPKYGPGEGLIIMARSLENNIKAHIQNQPSAKQSPCFRVNYGFCPRCLKNHNNLVLLYGDKKNQ